MELQPNRPPRILVASADPDMRSTVCDALTPLPCTVREAAGARESIAAAERERPELLISDMVLLDATGVALCRLLREHPRLGGLPLILLSSFTEEMDRILAFEAGVDDFVVTPYYPRELLSRVRAILRRAEVPDEHAEPPLQENAIHVDHDAASVQIHGRRIDLTPKEFRILAVLVRNGQRVLSRDRIIDEVWNRSINDPRVVDAHIKAIRRKLGPMGDTIETVRGVGFRYSPQHDEGTTRPSQESGSPPHSHTG